MNLGMPEIILIVIVFLIFFGPKKIPELAQGLGKGIREFRKGMTDVQRELGAEVTDAPMSGDREKELDRRELELLKREAELRKKLEGNA